MHFCSRLISSKLTIFSPRLLAIIIIVSSHPSLADNFSGKIIGVHDGDTATLLTSDHVSIKIRLASIDAPEANQSFGQKSKQSLSEMVFGREVVVEKETIDKYGRTVGVIFLGDTNINQMQLARGFAWVYRKYSNDASLLALEENAKRNKLGLWQDANPTPPWEFRHGSAMNNPPSINSNCGPKKYCSQMTSCAEALEYLKCGLSSLDRNGDGVPCNKICTAK